MGRIQEFLDLYGNKQSARTYRAAILSFLDFVYGKQRKGLRATKEEFQRYEELAEQYFTEGRDYFQDLMGFTVHLHESKTPPLTAKQRLIGVRQWFIENDIELTQKQLKRLRLRLPKGKAQTDELTITHEVIRKLLQHADTKMRALILVLASSGMRVGEVLSITIDDLELDRDPAKIRIQGAYTKTGERRDVFITQEAKEALEEWLKVREQYLHSAYGRNRGLQKTQGAGQKSLDDERVFPFDVRVAEAAWRRLLKKAGLLETDENTKVVKYRIHGLRKFFRSNLPPIVPVDVVEALMGHSGYLTECYRRYTEKQVAEFYRKGEHLLTIAVPEELKRVQEKLSEQDKELQQNRKLIEQVILENSELRKENEALREAIKKIERNYEQLAADFKEFRQLYNEIKSATLEKSAEKLKSEKSH